MGSIKLRGSADYFCEIVALEGDTFRIRELEDGENSELEQYRALAEERATVQMDIQGIQRKAMAESTETFPRRVTGEDGEERTVERPLPREYTAEEIAELRRLDREDIRLHSQANDYVVACGVVAWSLKDGAGVDIECNAANVQQLPTWVKARIADRVLAQTALMPGEGAFLDAGPNSSPAAKR
jgi:hypothetical protein